MTDFCQASLEDLDDTLAELRDVLQLAIEQPTLAEKKQVEIASRPTLKEARRRLSELRAAMRRLQDPASRDLFETQYRDRENKLRQYVTSMKEQIFPAASSTAPAPLTYAERKAAKLMGPGGADGSGFQNTEQVLTAASNMQQDALEAIERAEHVQYLTEQSGRETLQQLQLQTERIYQIDEELEDIRGQLDHASRDVKWFFRQVARDKCLLSLFGVFMLGLLAMLIIVIVKRK